jgi:polysaccharide pyruvyl transferase WcaK-like protein
MQQCDVFVGMRFHSLLLATVNKLPFLAVAYDTKCWRFVQENDYPFAVELEAINMPTMMRMFDQVIDTKGELAGQLGTIANEMYREAEEGLRKLPL